MWCIAWFLLLCFCFKQKTAYEMRISDWSSDVCSSDLEAAKVSFGVRLSIDKGVPLAAGMGGSAASAVAAAEAVNALLSEPFEDEDLLPFALEGERVASDPPHWDNVMASLLGGLVLAAREEPGRVCRLPVPDGVVSLLFHPAGAIETRPAPGQLQAEVPMASVVEHSRRLAAFVAGRAPRR